MCHQASFVNCSEQILEGTTRRRADLTSAPRPSDSFRECSVAMRMVLQRQLWAVAVWKLSREGHFAVRRAWKGFIYVFGLTLPVTRACWG